MNSFKERALVKINQHYLKITGSFKILTLRLKTYGTSRETRLPKVAKS